MKTPMVSFSNVSGLQNASLDLKALRHDGQLKVGDEVYIVTSGDDGKLVIKDSKAREFFSYVTDHISSHKAHAHQAQREVARILGEKQALAAQELREAICARDGGPDVQIASAVNWAQQCNKPQDKLAIYNVYRHESPGLRPMDEETTQVLFKTLAQWGKSRSVGIRHQSHDGKKEPFDIETFVKDRPYLAYKGFYRFENSRPHFSLPSNSRLSINVQPQYALDLLKALIKLMKENRSVLDGKIAAPGEFGQRTDNAILYLRGDYDAGLKIAEMVRQALPEAAFVEHTPGCMHRIAQGVSYAEHVPGHSSSHGQSRAQLIQEALAIRGDKPLKEKLATVFKKAGYHPQFPAFRLRSLG